MSYAVIHFITKFGELVPYTIARNADDRLWELIGADGVTLEGESYITHAAAQRSADRHNEPEPIKAMRMTVKRKRK